MEILYIWVIEYKYFEFGKGDKDKMIVIWEYLVDWYCGDELYYLVNN